MKKEKFKAILANILKNDRRIWTEEDELDQIQLLNLLDKYDGNILKIFLSDENIRESFFIKIGESYVFKHSEFKFYIEEHSPLANSYSEYINRIGLAGGKRYLKDSDDIVLNFPFKDCILEGGQSSDEGMEPYFEFYEGTDGAKTPELIGENEHVVVSKRKGAIKTVTGYEVKKSKRKEVFYNEVLAKDEIDRLLDKKALTNWKRYTKEGIKEVEEIKKDDEGTIRENLIIKGNNLLALHSLKEKFSGRVKLIYIDPPYNTGSDSFAYNDRFNHSTWLIFMKNRLEIAKELLRDDGVIFVQCDDNEQAYLKVLMDEVFRKENFINIISAKMKNIAGASGGGEDKRFKKNIEYLTIFAKNYSLCSLKSTYEFTEIYNLIQEYKKNNISWKYTSILFESGTKVQIASTVDGEGNEIKIYKRKNSIIKSISQVVKEEKLSEKEVYYKYINKIFTTAMPQSSIRIRVLEKLNELKIDLSDLISIQYIPRSGKNKGNLYEQFYKGDKLRLFTWLADVVEQKEEKIYKKDLQGTFWDGFNLNNLSKEGEVIFESGKKPEELIKKIIEVSTEPNDIVLDYHLGSGTAIAVAHKMKRQYIGIEQMNYIENIVCERIKKVIDNDQSGISKSVNWQGGGEFIYCELAKWNENAKEMILECDSVNKLIVLFDKLYDKYFLNYNLKIKEFKEKIIREDNFLKLDLNDQKKMFITMLDLNQMYINKDDMDDAKFQLSKNDREITKKFYE